MGGCATRAQHEGRAGLRPLSIWLMALGWDVEMGCPLRGMSLSATVIVSGQACRVHVRVASVSRHGVGTGGGGCALAGSTNGCTPQSRLGASDCRFTSRSACAQPPGRASRVAAAAKKSFCPKPGVLGWRRRARAHLGSPYSCPSKFQELRRGGSTQGTTPPVHPENLNRDLKNRGSGLRGRSG